MNQTPIEAWYGQMPSIRHLKDSCRICYSQIPNKKRHKLSETSEKLFFLVIAQNQKAIDYTFKTGKVIISHDVYLMKRLLGNGMNK